jgi:DNA-directed RNA polymerase subunit beta'
MLAEARGIVRFEDVVEGQTVRLEQEGRKDSKWIVIEHKGDKHPRIIIEDREGKILDFHHLPAKARVEVKEGDEVTAGALIARQPRDIAGTQDITGGLPRVTELFEARKPKEPATMAEISGTVELHTDKRRGKMTVLVKSDSGMEKEHHITQGKQLLVHAGDRIEEGTPLCEGPLIPHDILRISGEEELQRYLLKEVQGVYRQQNVTINDKHIEIIVGQMLRKVKIDSEGDTVFLPNEIVDKFRFRDENERLSRCVKIVDPGDTDCEVGQIVTKDEFQAKNDQVEVDGGTAAKGRKPKPASAKTLLLGITKASLQSESFISAASFQETTKVLTQASLGGNDDRLVGLKENVILGRLIPAGTGFKDYQDLKLTYDVEPLAEAVAPATTSLVGSGSVGRASVAVGA